MKELVVCYAKLVEKGAVINLRELYSALYRKFPSQCDKLGFYPSDSQEKWQILIRYGLWEARKQGLIKHVGSQRSGLWQRI